MSNFKTKARAIELLGKKQVREGVTALAELMKNSYDADANWIRVDFETKRNQPYILLGDDGYGMNQGEIEGNWLVLGGSSKTTKKRANIRTPKGRVLMGEKGIGRLAAARLGEQLWMFTKKEDSKWSVLYLNWNLFDNQNLFLEDVQIPVQYEIDFTTLRNNGRDLVRELVQKQRTNLVLPAWFDRRESEFYQKIVQQVDETDIPLEHVLAFCSRVENASKSQGTIMLLQNVQEKWERYLDKRTVLDSEGDIISKTHHRRLMAFVSTFPAKGLSLDLVHNREPVPIESGFSDEDFEIYDLRIEGRIEKGIFFGELFAPNAEESLLQICNDELMKGISVTTGLHEWQNYDCGLYTIKLCHIEDSSRTGLTNEEFSYIKEKLNLTGGISVFRDNVRVLPYGEPENDFLNMEERRSKNAGYYVFSHRNMFGRIDITTEENPQLEDKSSREGFIENEQYFYFLKTLENVLITVATNYVTTRTKKSKSLRESYITHNKYKKEREQLLAKEDELVKREAEKTKLLIEHGKKKHRELKLKFDSYLKSWKVKVKKVEVEEDYGELLELLAEFEKELNLIKYDLKSNIPKLVIIPSARYYAAFDDKIKEQIEEHNESVKESEDYWDLVLQVKSQEIGATLREKINELQKSMPNFESVLKRTIQLSGMVQEIHTSITEYVSHKEGEFVTKLQTVKENVEKIDRSHKTIKDLFISGRELNGYKKQLDDIQSAVQTGTLGKINEVSDKLQELMGKLDGIEENLHDYSIRIKQQINRDYHPLIEDLQFLISNFEDNSSKEDLFQLIGLLKEQNQELTREVEMNADLASFGMAAEIVNHEFNQLFTNVFDAIHRLRNVSLPNTAKYYIRQIEVGFRAISDRQSQLSPMYRSYNLPKRPVKVHDLVEDLRNFFAPTLERYRIEYFNKVHEDVVLQLSPSKIYPVLSNLIHNSIYWVLDQPVKQIVIQFDDEEQALYLEDTGPGIKRSIADHIFKPFYSQRPGGRGLGLSISKKVLESQGHSLHVELDPDKKHLNGACFRIVFSE